MKKTITVIMAHADDIEYSAGATLAKYIDQGHRALYGVLARCNSGWTVTQKKGGHLPRTQERRAQLWKAWEEESGLAVTEALKEVYVK